MTPEQEEQVRRALAAAARAEDQAEDQAEAGDHRAPLPADVAARLDDVLEGLLAPRVSAAEPTGADELARRRRRRWPTGLVAAAALCLIALAGGAVAIAGFGPGNESGSSSTTADSSTSDAEGAPNALAGGDPSTDSSTEPRELAASGASPTFRTDTLARDIRRLLDLPGALPTGEPPAWRCVAPPLAAGEQLLGVRLDGRRSSLVLGAPASGQRSARIYSCADPGTLVASTTVPSPDR